MKVSKSVINVVVKIITTKEVIGCLVAAVEALDSQNLV